MSYEKEKRKNDDAPSMFWTLLQGLWHYLVVLPLQGAWWLTRQTASGSWWLARQGITRTWRLATQTAREARWLIKNGAQLALAASIWAVNMPVRVVTWVWHVIMGLPPEFETQREKNIYRLFRRRSRRRNFFAVHTLAYSLGLFASAVVIIDILRNSGRPYVDPFQAATSTAAIAFVWTLVWIFHLIQKQSGDSEDKELRDALEHEYSRQQRKPKQRVYEDAYFDERLTEEYESNDNHNHSAEYYEDEDGYTARKR